MSRRSSRRLVVPEAEQGLNAFKAVIMQREGYLVNPKKPEDVKYEVAKKMGIPLKPSDNGILTTENAGKIGGKIGGAMVRELVRLGKEQLANR
jgi:small acid-soluble spore protein D (minor alpha/beta-type SASP)